MKEYIPYEPSIFINCDLNWIQVNLWKYGQVSSLSQLIKLLPLETKDNKKIASSQGNIFKLVLLLKYNTFSVTFSFTIHKRNLLPRILLGFWQANDSQVKLWVIKLKEYIIWIRSLMSTLDNEEAVRASGQMDNHQVIQNISKLCLKKDMKMFRVGVLCVAKKHWRLMNKLFLLQRSAIIISFISVIPFNDYSFLYLCKVYQTKPKERHKLCLTLRNH